ncbi:MAG: xanthine dehydrogenase family protein molybdopterin-binding subunit [Acidimicrobiales bacterium]
MRFVGESIPRVEDHRILSGRGKYVDDLNLPNMLHASFVRSPFAHALIKRIDVTAARATPGVVAVFTGDDMRRLCNPISTSLAFGVKFPEFYPLSTDKVRFVGDVVALVVAESRYEAEDGCDLVEVEYEQLPAIANYDDAVDPTKPALFDELGDNVVITSAPVTWGDVDAAFAEADRVVTATLRQHRVAPVPMETRGAVADYDASSGDLTYYASTQSPHSLRLQLATTLGHPMERFRVLANDVGGGFGLKGSVVREDFCIAAASKALGRPLKWIEDRNEHLIASGQAREEMVEVELAVKADGTFLGMKGKLTMDAGAYPNVPFVSAMFVGLMQLLLPGPYRMKGYRFESSVISTNKAAYVAYRGPWEMETWVRERLIDIVAHEIGVDAADIRRTNMMLGAPDDRLMTGLTVRGISSRESLDKALEFIDYEGFRKEQATARTQGRYLGVGFATFIEAAPGPAEMRPGGGMFGGERAKVTLQPDGHLVVTTAQAPHGQGHETTLAQVAADEMGVPFEHVRVVHGDTRQTPFSVIGTGGSRASTWATGATIVSTRKLREHVLAIASGMLEISPEDLEIVDGVVTPKGVPQKKLPLAQIAMKALMDPASLPPGTDGPLEAHERFTGEGITGSGWSGGTHACTIEVDVTTGRVKILRYVVVEDCGRVINPAVVDGQVCGGVAQGIGAVLYERATYDDEANFLTSTFMDYLLPTSAEIPHIEIHHLETDPDGAFGFRGVGEGGAVVAPATLTNAVDDALQPFGARVCDQYLPPAKVVELAGGARE